MNVFSKYFHAIAAGVATILFVTLIWVGHGHRQSVLCDDARAKISAARACSENVACVIDWDTYYQVQAAIRVVEQQCIVRGRP